jgi:uncharacterized protein
MTILIALGTILFVVVLLMGILAALLGLAGTALILLDGVIYSAATHWQRPHLWVLLVLALLALVAETLDNIFSGLAARYHGGSPQTGWAAMIGGIGGALLGSWAGSAVGAFGLIGGPGGFILCVVLVPLILALLGGYYAAYWYELRQGRTPDEAHLAGKGALIGRLLGVMGKSLIAVIMSAILLWAVFVH